VTTGEHGAAPVVERLADAARFLERAHGWLEEREDENNLMLSIAHARVERPGSGEEADYYAVVRQRGRTLGCAIRTPPYSLLVTDLESDALSALAADVRRVYATLPGVMGPPPASRRFARGWGRARSVAVRPGIRQRLYGLRQVVHPEHRAPGRMRMASPADLELLAEWFHAFAIEAGVPFPSSLEEVRRRVESGAIAVWDDGDVTSVAGVGGRTRRGARVGPVYTPPRQRGRGYATTLVADLSQRLLDDGVTHCVLFTDLSNATSNRIYQAIGYRPLCDTHDYVFDDAE
jgi:predicted GNAT family acetyltransferase